MDDFAWCCSCSRTVSLEHAIAELPCPGCGGSDYFVVTGSAEQDALLSLAERMQRVGRWAVAENAIRRCAERGYISDADCALSIHNLVWRMECVGTARNLICESVSPLTVSELRSALLRDYDTYVVDWLLQEFTGLRLVPAGDTYVVEVVEDAP